MQAGNWSHLALLSLPACPMSLATSSWGLFCLAHLKSQSLLTPKCPPTDLKMSGHELEFWRLFRILYIESICCLQNNFWSILRSIETNFYLEILFSGWYIRNVFWRIEDQQSSIPSQQSSPEAVRNVAKPLLVCPCKSSDRINCYLFGFVSHIQNLLCPDPRLLAF